MLFSQPGELSLRTNIFQWAVTLNTTVILGTVEGGWYFYEKSCFLTGLKK